MAFTSLFRCIACRFARQSTLLFFGVLFLLAAARPLSAQAESAGIQWDASAFLGVAAYSPSTTQPLLAVADGFAEITLIQPDGTVLQTITTGQTGAINALAFSPDGTILASASADMTIDLWNVSDGALMNTLVGHTDSVNAVAFSPDGQTLASGSSDQTIDLWNVSDGTLLNTLQWAYG